MVSRDALARLLAWVPKLMARPPQPAPAGADALVSRFGDMPEDERAPPQPSPAISFSSRLRSIGFAWSGLVHLARSEPNARLHVAATIVVVLAGLGLGVDSAAWRWIALAIGWVWFAEALNTAFERVCDLVSPERDERVRIAKDVAAGAVLASAVAAAVIGALTLWPYIAALFR
jgi:diacylglycerol kinase (ATP)